MERACRYAAEAFAAKMDGFIGYCEAAGVDATDYQLIEYFGISSEALEQYRVGDKTKAHALQKHVGYAAALKKLDLYREDATIRQIVREPKLASHGALKLKQPHWGGWGDKQELPGDIGMRVKIGDGARELLD